MVVGSEAEGRGEDVDRLQRGQSHGVQKGLWKNKAHRVEIFAGARDDQ